MDLRTACLLAVLVIAGQARYLKKRDVGQCMMDTCKNGGTCRQNGDNYICACKPGFGGKNCEEQTCHCSVLGLPHISTFDGAVLAFKGQCDYQLAKMCSTAADAPEPFDVTITNGLYGKVTVLAVTVKVYGQTIRIQLHGHVFVNGENRANLPINVDNKRIQLNYLPNDFIQVQTDFGLRVSYGIESGQVDVEAPSQYKNKMCGICGNCDANKQNDLVMKGGKSVADIEDKRERGSSIGNSWKVGGRSGCKASSKDDFLVACNGQQLERAGEADLCGFVNHFSGSCGNVNLEDMQEACKQEVCGPASISIEGGKSALCTFLNTLERTCAGKGNGHRAEFMSFFSDCKNINLCQGPKTPKFDTSCPSRCDKRDAPKVCPLPDINGCQCPENMVLSDTVCVPVDKPEECGCVDGEGSYREVGERWQNSACSKQFVCQSDGQITEETLAACEAGKVCNIVNGIRGCHEPVDPCDGVQCLNGAECTAQDSGYTCVCLAGFEGAHCETNVDECNGVVCQNGGVCEDGINGYKCKCPSGYLGQHCEEVQHCTCYIYGDPATETYDNAFIHFHGTCMSSYSYVCDNAPSDLERFQVEVKQEKRFEAYNMSYPRFVDVKIADPQQNPSEPLKHTFRIEGLDSGGLQLRWNEEIIQSTPLKAVNGKVDVYLTPDKRMKIKTDFGLTVSFDGDDKVIITVDRKYAGHLCGICGNCNGAKRDDFKTRQGYILSLDINPLADMARLGNSFKSLDNSGERSCQVAKASDTVVDCEDREDDVKSICNDITSPTGPFKDCLAVLPEGLAQDIYESCTHDVCKSLVAADMAAGKKAGCTMKDLLAKECIYHGAAEAVKAWRTTTGCALSCPSGQVFKAEGSACPADCMNKNPTCSETMEGCYCASDNVLSSGTCVSESECGCVDEKGSYHKKHEQFEAIDCSKQSFCVGNNVIIPLRMTGCHEKAECIVEPIGGKRTCQCKRGYVGANGQSCRPMDKCNEVDPGLKKRPDCSGRGKCFTNYDINDWYCTCQAGFTGKNCETDINECEANPDPDSGPICKNGGECVDGTNSYSCVCLPGYTGIDCSVNIDDCESSPCVRGECTDLLEYFNCTCPQGWTGKLCESRITHCECVGVGDPHFRTYDGAWMDFMGTCKYELAGKCLDSVSGLPDWQVHVVNNDRGKEKVAWVNSVDVMAFNHTITIGQKKKTMVDGLKVSLPHVIPGVGQINIDLTPIGFVAVDVQLTDDIKLVVKFDGDHYVKIWAPNDYKGHMCGICGDCDDNRDNDYTAKNGTSYSQLTNKKERDTIIGNSYKVDEQRVCRDGTQDDGPDCTEEATTFAEGLEYCGYLNRETFDDSTNPFHDCFMSELLDQQMVDNLFSSCKEDVCLEFGNPDAAKKAACSFNFNLAQMCESIGVDVANWRETTNCPAQCINGMEFRSSGPACPNTCKNPTAEETCTEPNVDGCYCPQGQLMSDGVCVTPDQCGCLDSNESYHPLGTSWLSDDCARRFTCESVNGSSQIKDEEHGCDVNARCTITNGERRCVCQDPFRGDGRTCIAPPCDSGPCLNNGACEDLGGSSFRCICVNGFTGPNCELPPNPCEPNQCLNGAVCQPSADRQSFTCECVNGFRGRLCDIPDPCDPNPCENNGNCIDNGGSDFSCDCVNGFTGPKCEVPPNPCEPNQCLNGAVCQPSDDRQSFTCECVNGFRGRLCEISDPCDPNPCNNNGACEDLGGSSFRCNCVGGFTGPNCEVPPNPCEPNQCLNGAVCQPSADRQSFTCECVNGFRGRLCEIPDPCDPNPCENDGSCNDNGGSDFRCDCVNGFTGPKCEVPPNPCEPNQCLNGAVCQSSDDRQSFTCECANGFRGRLCDIPDPCDPNPCENNGNCIDNGGSDFSCDCVNGFTGPKCEVPPNPCEPNQCLNGAVCQPSDDRQSFTCECANGFRGRLCDIPDPCDPNPCENNGNCIDNGGSDFSCDCVNGFTGPKCEVPPNPCEPNQCLNGAVCQPSDDRQSFTCECANGFRGRLCDIPDPCDPNPCENNGNCIDNGGSDFSCDCVNGFTGPKCEVPPNPCDGKVCQNGATCKVQDDNSAICECINGFAGNDCEINVDDCSGITCENGGTCSDLLDDFFCQCNLGFVGKNCEMPRNSTDYCDKCIDLRNGPGHYENPQNCSSFFQCSRDSLGRTNAVQMFCPPGMFWKQEDLTCVECKDAVCTGVPDGPPDCTGKAGCPSGYYANPATCRGYFHCSPQGPVRKCCPLGQRWSSDGTACVRDASCNDQCIADVLATTPPVTMTTLLFDILDSCTANGYTKHSIRDDPNNYVLLWNGYQLKRPCPAGSEFDINACDCVRPGMPSTCTWPSIIACFPFNENYLDITGRVMYVDQGKTYLTTGYAGNAIRFDGNTHVEIPYFNNYEFGYAFSASFWFRRDAANPLGKDGLLNNGDCNNFPTFDVHSVDSGVGGGVYTNKNHNLTHAYENIQAQLDQWHHVVLTWNGQTTLMYRDGQLQTASNENTIIDTKVFLKRTPVPFILGRSFYCDPVEGDTHLRGYIDELKLYAEALSQDQVDELFTEFSRK